MGLQGAGGSQAEGQKACQPGAVKEGPPGLQGGRPGARAWDFKSRMFGWGLSPLSNKQSTTLFKTERHLWGRARSPYFHIFSLGECHKPPGKDLLRGGMGGSGRDQDWAAAALGPEVTWGHPSSCWTCDISVLPTGPPPCPHPDQRRPDSWPASRGGPENKASPFRKLTLKQ